MLWHTFKIVMALVALMALVLYSSSFTIPKLPTGTLTAQAGKGLFSCPSLLD